MYSEFTVRLNGNDALNCYDDSINAASIIHLLRL